jgi:hypothetical protein
MQQHSYGVSSKSYLRRAVERLAESEQQSLFYAAFEIRCGIEARLQDYLDALEQIPARKKKGWKIIESGLEVEKAFQIGEKIVEAKVYGEANEFLFPLYYIPVTARLRKAGARLGQFLHAMKRSVIQPDSWWESARSFVCATAETLADTNRGTLLGPIMRTPKGRLSATLHYVTKSDIGRMIDKHMKKGLNVSMSHLDALPANAAPSLNPIDGIPLGGSVSDST